MNRFAMMLGLGVGLLLLPGPADAQWRYTDDKGESKVTQYKLSVPAAYRDAAEWIGPIGIGKPALSADQILAAQLADAIRRIVTAEAGLLRFKTVEGPARAPGDSGAPGKPMASMCIAGEQRIMTSPGSWKVVGSCGSGFSTSYGTSGYGSTFGGFVPR